MARAFVARGRADRHQFRFIVAPEDSVEMGDLRGFARDLMRQLESDLGTQLDWVAVDHHNTCHPHTHVIVRGITDDGKILNISGDYIAHGIRHKSWSPIPPGRPNTSAASEAKPRHGIG
jgi:type IV secretory pathway VirD2 relaxase